MTSPFSADGRVLDLNRWEAQLKFQAAGGVRGAGCGAAGRPGADHGSGAGGGG